jgi:hypothetical protein
LDAFDVHESGDYLRHQLRVAGAEPERVLTDEAMSLLARHTSGLPRALNQAAAQALNLAEMQQAEMVDAEAALEALNLLGTPVELDAPEEEISIARPNAEAAELIEHREEREFAPALSVTSGFPMPGSYTVPSEIARAYIYQPGEPVQMIFGENRVQSDALAAMAGAK